IHIYTQTCTHILYTHTNAYTHVHVYTQTCIHILYTHTHTHTPLIHIHAHTHTLTHTHMYRNTDARTYTDKFGLPTWMCVFVYLNVHVFGCVSVGLTFLSKHNSN